MATDIQRGVTVFGTDSLRSPLLGGNPRIIILLKGATSFA